MKSLPLLTEVSALWALVWPALLIAGLRTTDVTLSVVRTVFTVQGRKAWAALVYGIEGAVWISAAGIVFANLTPVRVAGYVGGIMAGTWVGMRIIEQLRLGMVTVRIYVGSEEDPTIGHGTMHAIHAAGYGATLFDGTGYRGPVHMILSTVRRRDADHVVRIAQGVREDAFVALDNEPMRYPGHARV